MSWNWWTSIDYDTFVVTRMRCRQLLTLACVLYPVPCVMYCVEPFDQAHDRYRGGGGQILGLNLDKLPQFSRE